MTQPRMVLPGDVVLVTSRVIARFFLLRPDPALNAAFAYLLAEYARRNGVEVYAGCVMSTHWHLVLMDQRGQLPCFLRDFNHALANWLKVHRGFAGSVFQPHPNVVRLQTAEAVVDKIAYVLANPVAAGAVRDAREWPGFRTTLAQMNAEPRRCTRPTKYFASNGIMPEAARLGIRLPRIVVDAHGPEGAKQALVEAAREHASHARREAAEKGWTFWGAKKCRHCSPYRRATSTETIGDRVPTFATKGGGEDAFFDAVAQLRAFRQAYREALQEWQRGVRTVAFPYGTWWMRVVHGACSTAPS